MQLVVPMSGIGKRFIEAGYQLPKPIIQINGVSIIERLLSRFPKDQKTFFILSEDHKDTELPQILMKLRPHGNILFIPAHKLGPGHAVEKVLPSLDKAEPILITYCDYDMGIDYEDFRRFTQTTNCDSCLISYRGFHAHYINPQTYAFSRLIDERVVEVREKGSFTNDRESEYASCGAYYFRSVEILEKSLRAQKELKLILNGEYYISLTVEALLQLDPQAHVRVYEISQFFQFGTPQDLENYAFWEKSFKNASQFAGLHPDSLPTCKQLLIPMAGMGSRFKSITQIPKPFIPIRDRSMVYHATKSLPKAEKTVWVTLKEVQDQAFSESKYLSNTQLVTLESTPSGQALSTAAGLETLNQSDELVISSCDHGIVLNPKIWTEFRKKKNIDAAIFSITNFPGTLRTPKSFAYVETDSDQMLSKIINVSVKKTVSSNPYNDKVLVGTFWVSSVDLIKKYIDKLINLDIRVNNELYLDSAFELMVNDGLNVVNIPLDGYLCWGDPDSLAEALYWDEVFNGRKISRRSRYPGLKHE